MYYICKFNFISNVHFGKQSLDGAKDNIDSDTLFSAIINEAVSLYGEEIAKEIYNMVLNKEFIISDTYPFKDKELFLPKPIIHNSEFEVEEKEEESLSKKDYKNLKYIPFSMFNRYLDKIKGGADFSEEEANRLRNLDYGNFGFYTKNKIVEDNDTELYDIEYFTFKENCGLYFIANIPKEFNEKFMNIMDNLGLTGIGGKRSTGFGGFDFIVEEIKLYEELEKLLNSKLDSKYNMLLSFTVPQINEKVKGYYILEKKSGFRYSVMSNVQRKKKDIYGIKSGSVLLEKIDGNILDIKTKEDNHSVYKYGVPLYIGL